MKRVLIASLLLLGAGCAATPPSTATTQPVSGIINPLTGQPLTGSDIQSAAAEISGILSLAQEAGLSNNDVTAVQAILPTVANAAADVVQNQGATPSQAVLSDVVDALNAYKAVKTAIATHPKVQATVKAKATK